MVSLALLAVAPAAQTGTKADATQPPAAHTSTVPQNTRVVDADGREVNVGPGGGATVKHEGKLKNHPTEQGVKVCDKIVEVEVRSGGCTSLGLKGTMTCTVDRSGTTVTSEGTGQGNPPSTDGATVNVNGDNVTVNANGTNTTVNQNSGAQNTTVNTGSGSSGSVTYPGGQGYSGSVNFGAGSGRLVDSLALFLALALSQLIEARGVRLAALRASFHLASQRP